MLSNIFIKKKSVYFLIVLIMGGIGSIAFSPYDFWPAAIISLCFLQILIINHNLKYTAIIGLFWGIGFFGSGINWIFISISSFGGMPFLVNIVIVFIFVLYLAIYPSIFATILNRLCPTINIYRMVFVSPALWQIIEYLRGKIFSGFPWLQFGYTQINGPLKSLAPIGGVEIITFYIMTIVGLIVYSYAKRILYPLLAILLILIMILPLSYLKWYKPLSEIKTNVSLIQGNIPQTLKWDKNYLQHTLDIYFALSKNMIKKQSIIIWPECAIPDLEFNQQKFLYKLDYISRLFKSHIITGIIDSDEDKNNLFKKYNSILVLGNNHNPYKYNNINRYRKHHLVPFGEFIPLKKVLKHFASLFNFPMSTLHKGKYIQNALRVNNYNITSIICYEIIFGEQIRSNFNSHTNFLLAISNNAWFGNSIGPWQHFQMARMRALELGTPLLHCTNNGITAIINPDGNIESILPQFRRMALNQVVIPTQGSTPYSKLGALPIWILTLINIMISIHKMNLNFHKMH